MKDPVEAGRPLADAIAAETARRDLNQREAAEIIGTTQQTFGKWVNYRVRPSDQHIPGLAKYLSMTEETVRQLRGQMRGDPKDRLIIRTRIDALEQRVDLLVSLLESLATRLDALLPPGE